LPVKSNCDSDYAELAERAELDFEPD